MSYKYTNKFLRFYLNVKDIFYTIPTQNNGVQCQEIKNYDNPNDYISWDEETFDIYQLDCLLKELLTTTIAEEIENGTEFNSDN